MTEELQYKCTVLERALDVLDTIPDSTLRAVHRAIEGGAQAVWRRRLTLHASDLVRFGRVSGVAGLVEGVDQPPQRALGLFGPHRARVGLRGVGEVPQQM